MDGSQSSPLDLELDILSQQTLLEIYTQITLCFGLPTEAYQGEIVEVLRAGLKRLAVSFPWVAGQVVNEGADETSTGIFEIAPLEEAPRLFVKDYTADQNVPSMEDFRKLQFPMRLLDESVIAPYPTIPGAFGKAMTDKPVFCLQANFIRGGLLLTFVAHHKAMDMTGQGQVIKLLSKACRDEAFTKEEITTGNLTRKDMIPYLPDDRDPGQDIAHQILQPAAAAVATEGVPPPPPPTTWAVFSFSGDALTALKAEATKSVSTGFISTDDALTALIWQAITRVRLSRLATGSGSHLARAVDVRRFLDVATTYPGLLQNMTYHEFPAIELASLPVGVVASNLRAALLPKVSKLTYQTRALATYIHRSAMKNDISFVANLDLMEGDIMLSSWAKEECYSLDFRLGNGIGSPECVRRPKFSPFESLLYLLPRRGDGEVSAALCLRDGDLEKLKRDEVFGVYGEFVG